MYHQSSDSDDYDIITHKNNLLKNNKDNANNILKINENPVS